MADLLANAKKAAQEAAKPVAQEATHKGSKGTEYQRRKREEAYQAALTIKAALEKAKVALTEEEQKAIDLLTRKPGTGAARGAIGGKPIIYKLFGDAPKKGDSVTAQDMFLRTGKGFAEIKNHIKKWAEKGVVVKFDEKSKTFVLDSDIPAYTVEADKTVKA